MDDQLQNHETSAAAVATLPRVPSAAEIERRLQRREQQRATFMWRAQTWETARAAELGTVEFPRDEAEVIALGVPCEDCLALIVGQGEAGHRVRFGLVPGTHWATFVVAQCGRSGL